MSTEITTLGVKVTTKGAAKARNEINSLGIAAESVKSKLGLLSGALAAFGVGKALKASIKYTASIEDLRIQLKFLTGSTKNASKAFSEMTKFASETPFALQEIQQSTASLLVAVGNDTSKLGNMLNITGEIAVQFGLSFLKTSEQLQRAMSAGISSADIFREKGVSAMMGFRSGVAYSVKDTERMIKKWAKANKGAINELKDTFTGKVSMMSDAWDKLLLTFGEAGVLDIAKDSVQAMTDALKDPETIKTIKSIGENLGTIIETITIAGVAYGALTLKTYAQVKANKLFTTSTIITRSGLMGLGGTITTTTKATGVLTVSMRALKAAIPFAGVFLALEAATWAFKKSTEESFFVVKKQTKYLDLYKQSITGVTKAFESQNQLQIKKQVLAFDVDIETIMRELQVASVAYQEVLAKFKKQSPKKDPLGVIFKEKIALDILAKTYQGATLAKEQFLNKETKKLESRKEQNVDKIIGSVLNLTDKLTKKRTELGKITDAQIDAEKLLGTEFKNSKITLEQYTHGVNIMKTEIQNYKDVIKKIAFDKKMEKIAQNMEDSITNSLMNIGQGLNSFKDMATNIFRQIAAEMVRAQISRPLASAASGFLGNMFGSMLGAPAKSVPIVDLRPPTFAGGGFTGRGSRSGGVDGQGGFNAILHPNETIIDHKKGQNIGGDINISVVYSPKVNALDPKTAAIVIAENAPIVVGIIRQAFNRNGQSISI